MNPALQKWWDAHSEREQRLLLAGGAAVAALLLLATLLPLHRSVAAARQRVQDKQDDLAWLQSVEPQLAASRPVMALRGESLLALATRTARSAGVGGALSSQPSGESSIRVHVENVGFDSLMGWLTQLQDSYGVEIESATIDSLPDAGAATASLVLRRR